MVAWGVARSIARGPETVGVALPPSVVWSAVGKETKSMSDQVDAETEIRTARAVQNKAIADRDFDAAAQIWTEDVTMRRALGQAVTGRPDYRALLVSSSSGPAPVIYQRTAVSVDVSDRWPLAYEEGRWAGHAGDATGQAVV